MARHCSRAGSHFIGHPPRTARHRRCALSTARGQCINVGHAGWPKLAIERVFWLCAHDVWATYLADECIRGLIMCRRYATYGWLKYAQASRRRATERNGLAKAWIKAA